MTALFVLAVGCSHQTELDRIARTYGSGGTSSSGAGSNVFMAGEGGTAGDVTTTEIPSAGAFQLDDTSPVLAVFTGDFTHYDEHDRTLSPELVSVSGQPFALAQRFPLGSGTGTPGSAGYFGPTRIPIEAGDLLRAFFWTRCARPSLGADKCRSGVVFEEVEEPYVNGGLDLSFYVGSEWQLSAQTFAALRSYPAGSVQLTFRIGFPEQILEIGAIGVEIYEPSVGLERLTALDEGPYSEVVTASGFSGYGNAVMSERVSESEPFGRTLRFSTRGASFSSPQDSGFQGRSIKPVRANQPALVMFWARCAQSDRTDANCLTSLVFEESQSPYINAGLATPPVVVGPDWKPYFFPFKPLKEYEIERVKLGLRLGYPNQVLELGPITVRQYGPEYRLEDMLESEVGTP